MTTLVLGIETSCDETAAAVVRDGREILSNVVFSQTKLHERWRGVVPEVASRSHTTRILPTIEEALTTAGASPQELAGVAVSHRPGMIGCLLVGLSAAKALSWRFRVPLVGVDHVLAHVHAGYMSVPELALPGVALIASGGHTALYAVTGPLRCERIGSTRDDAAGEALDKGAALLGLPYPGGPAIQEAAKHGDPKRLALPRTMLAKDSLDFSFSGMKTALLYALRGNALQRPMPELTEQDVADYAASYQQAIVDVLVEKIVLAVRGVGARSISIGGGVARNALLRERLKERRELASCQVVFPPLDLCSDNGAMIAGLGACMLAQCETSDLGLEAFATTRPHPRTLAR